MVKVRLAAMAIVAALLAAVAVPAVAGSGDITGYPNKIATVDLSGYKLQWCFQAAYHIKGFPSRLKAGIP